MKIISKRTNPKANSGNAGAYRRQSELLHRPFDEVAYAAALEVLG